MNQGLKSYTKQFTHDVSGVGRLAFNMCGAAKNMHMIIPLISTVGQSPINLSLIYNEQDKDVTGQFGKGFRLSTYQKLTYMNMPAPMGLIANIKNADGSVDNYVPLTNPETGYTLSYEHIEDILYGYFLRDQQGNEVQLATTFSHPVMIRNKNGETMSFDSSLDNLNYIQNEYGDIVNFNTSGNTITATYTHNGTVVSKTVLTLQDSQIVYIKYYEGSSTLVGETNIRYLSNGILLTNAITYNLTKVVYENNSYKIYDGFMNGYQEEEFSSTPDYTITYNSILENKPSQTSIKDKFNNLHYYCFDNLNRLNMEIDKEGRVRSFHYDKDTKNLLSMDNVFIKENNNLAKNLQFSISTSEDNSLDNYSQENNAVSEIWNKMKFYNQPAEETKIISCEGEAGDIVTLSFFLTTYLQVQNGGVIITLSCGGETITKSFENKANGELELHSLSLKTKEKYSSISVKLKILNNVSVRLGMFTLLNNAFHQDMVYEGKYISTIANGTNVTSIDYDTNKNPTKVTIKEKTWLERIFNDKNLVTQSTNKYGTVTNIEYDDDYPTNVVKEQIVCESEAIMVEEKKEYSPDGRFLKADYDEFGEKTQFEYDSLGRVTKVTDALNNVLSTTYEKGLLKTLKLNSSTQNTYTYDERNRLTKIELPGSSNYEFVYDYKNQITQIKMNGIVILTYTYDSLGNITRQRYGTSGDYYDFVYDSKNRVVQIKFNGSLKYEYEYENDLLVYIFNEYGYTIKEFIYDEHKRLIRTEDYSNSLYTTVENQINNENKITGKSITVGTKTLHKSFDDFERSDDASISSSGDVKTIGFAGTNLTSDTQAVMEVFDIYPLHHDADPIESTKVKPFTFTHKNVGGQGQPKTPFVYNSEIKRFVYCANHGTLAYKFGNSTSGTVMARVLKTTTNNEYLFGFIDTNGSKIDVLLEGAGNIVLYVNGNVVTSTRMSFSRNIWHTVALSYGKGTNASSTDTTHTRYYRLFLDGTVKTYSVSSSTEYTSMKSCIGYSESSSNSFTGCIEMLCFRNAYCEESTLDELMNAINIISTKSYVDEFQRINKKEVIKGSTNIISNEFEYDTTTYWLQKYATYRVEKEVIKAGNNTIATRTYTYDKLGRVTKITDSKFGTKTYAYNDRGFLTNDNGTTITYEGNGNIKKYGSDTFEYDATVKDKLFKYKGVSISYSSSNPLSIESTPYHYMEYEGKRMTYCESGAGYGFYEYNEQGLRTKKDWYGSPGITSFYYYDGDKLVTEVRNSDRLDFLYDESGLLYGFIFNNTNKYFYVRDILQNILGIIDESGNLVVKYDYNAFGKILSVTDTSGLSIGEINPFRYKGYYYDEETQLYWVSLRYYSPELCRWISPDSIEYLDPQSINGLNLYCYCGNDPINKYDPSGHFAIWVFLGVVAISAIAGAIDGGVTAAMSGQNFWKGFAAGAIGGAVGGAINYFLPGAGNLLGRAASTMIYDITNEIFQTGKFDINNLDLYVADTFMDVVLSMFYLDKVSSIANPFISAALGGTLDAVVDIIQTPLYFTPEAQERIRGMSSRNTSSNSMYVNKCIYAY